MNTQGTVVRQKVNNWGWDTEPWHRAAEWRMYGEPGGLLAAQSSKGTVAELCRVWSINPSK